MGSDDSGENTSGEVSSSDTSESDTSESTVEVSEQDVAEAFNEGSSKSGGVETSTSDTAEKSSENGNAKSDAPTSMVTSEEIASAFNENPTSGKNGKEISNEKDPVSGKTSKEITNEKAEVSYERPTNYRSGLRDQVWENAKDEHGRVRDPVTGRYMSKDQPWDMGHKPGFEFAKHKESAKERGISRKEFLDEYNNPDHFRPELPSSNRSHKGESKTENYYD